MKLPVSKVCCGPPCTSWPLMLRGPGSIARLARSLTVMFRSICSGAESASGMSCASWNSYQDAFLLFARWTVQVDVGVGGGQLRQRFAAGIKAVDGRARGLPLEGIVSVAIETTG